MAWFACLGAGGGGSAADPVFTEEVIVDNSSAASSFTFDEDYHDYDFVKITYTNSDNSNTETVYVTPDALDAFFDVAQRFTVNFYATNVYATYSQSISGDTITWSRTNQRTCNITEIKGVNCTNYTVTETEVYKASALSGTAAAITSQASLFGYDYLFVVTNSSDRTEVVPCNSCYSMKNFTGDARIGCNGYNNAGSVVTVTANGMTAWKYYYVGGIKFTAAS